MTIYNLRHSELPPNLALLLNDIIYAYRPHSAIPTKDELEAERIDKSHCSMVELAKDVGREYVKQRTD